MGCGASQPTTLEPYRDEHGKLKYRSVKKLPIEPQPTAAPSSAAAPAAAARTRRVASVKVLTEYEAMKGKVTGERLQLRGFDEEYARQAVAEAHGKFTFGQAAQTGLGTRGETGTPRNALTRDQFAEATRMMLRAAKKEHLEEKLTAYALDAEFEDADQDHSGQLSEEEFFVWYNRFHDWLEANQ